MNDIIITTLAGLLSGLAFGVVGLALMAAGFAVVDALTPGKLRDLIWVERRLGASVLTASNLVGVAAIVTTAIATSHDDFTRGIISTIVYGLIGLLLMAISFVVVDKLTPGKLGEELCAEGFHPALWVNVAAHIGVAAIVCAAIS